MLKNKVFILEISFILLLFTTLVSATPFIGFIASTPNNATTSTANYATINTSLITAGSGLSSLIFNWNGTNYTMYNNSLVLMYNFDNISALGENNTKVVDSSLSGNNGTITGATWTTSGKYNSALSFDGNDNVLASRTNLPTGNSDYSIFAWIYMPTLPSAGTYPKLVEYGACSYYQLNCFLLNNDGGTMRLGNGNYGDDDYVNYAFLANTWYHVGVVKISGTKLFYVNGVNVANASVTTLNIVSSWGVYIGAGDTSGSCSSLGNYFNGTIDEVRIYNRSLSSTEIQQLYYSNLNKYSSTSWLFYSNRTSLTPSLYTYYAFTSAQDTSTNQTETRYYTVGTIPVLTIVSPTAQNYSTSTINFNVSSNETLNSCVYSLNSGASNTSMTSLNSTYYYNIATIANGAYTAVFWCNGSYNLPGTASVKFNVSQDLSPTLSFGTNPVDYYNSTSSNVTFDFKCQDDISISSVQLWTNTTGTWQANYTNSSYTNNTWLNITVAGISNGAYKWAVKCIDTGSHSVFTSSNRTFNVSQGCSITLTLSPILSSSVKWSTTYAGLTNVNADGNNGDSATSYYVSLTVSPTTDVCKLDLYTKADSNLSDGTKNIALNNEKFSYSLSDSTVPSGTKYNLTTSYTDNKIATNVANGTVIYLKYFLNIPNSQTKGYYLNNIYFKAVNTGSTP